MAHYNRIIIIGNLTRDPDYKQVGSGHVCRLGIASNRQYKNRQTGTLVQEVCFVDVDVWGPQAENCKQYLQKGRQVLIEGRLKYDTWQDTEGKTRSKHIVVADQVVFLGNGPQDVQGSEASEFAGIESGPELGFSKQKNPKPIKFNDDEFKDEPPFEDELPF